MRGRGLHSCASGALLALCVMQCAPAPRFALRPVIAHDPDRVALAHRPATTPDDDTVWALDNLLLRPVSDALRFEHVGEAHDVNALDEVPDSSWFTNRSVSVAEAAEGACRDRANVEPPFTVTSAKIGGFTAGFFVRDASGRRFALKFDQSPWRAPELGTAADAITSRLYWSIGYNTPCNRVGRVRVSDLHLSRSAYYLDEVGAHRPLDQRRFEHSVALMPTESDGTMRVALSEFVEGEPLGPWPASGVRRDDPNDVIAHEDRRELRGERLLAAWVNHWDAREPNALDTFVTGPEGAHVAHWMLDFGDTLGGAPMGASHGPRVGYSHMVDPGESFTRMVTLGFYRAPWEALRIDASAPSLGYFDAQHFDPPAWQPWIPLRRFEVARAQDLAWMARKIAAITPAHLDAMIASGHFSDARVASRLHDILVRRRERILRWSFAHTSPIAQLTMEGTDRLCAIDLAVTTGIGNVAATVLTADLRVGAPLHPSITAPTFSPGGEPGSFCVRLPHEATNAAADNDPARYVVLELLRTERNRVTRLAAHLYDLGPDRGFALVGIERW